MKVEVLRVALPSLTSRSAAETEAFGSLFAKSVYPGLLVLLHGDLGAGKTCLVRAIGTALGAKNVKSPTFAVETVHALPGKNFSLVHADLYRLRDAKSALMQLEEYLDDGHTVLVEWGEKWRTPPLADRWEIAMSLIGDDARSLSLSAFGGRAAAALSVAYTEILGLCGRYAPCR